MPPAFSPHNPTAHLQAAPQESRDHGCGCCTGDKHDVDLPQTPPIDEQIVFYDLALNPDTMQVQHSVKSKKPSELKGLEDALTILNDFHSYLHRSPFPHCPPPPQALTKDSRCQKISAIKDEGNQAFKSNNFSRAIELYTAAAEAAMARPLFEQSIWIKEELSVILCNRAAAYSSAKMFIEAICDADAVIALKRNWSKGHFRKAKALQGLNRIDQAKDAALLGLEFEPDSADLGAVIRELNSINL